MRSQVVPVYGEAAWDDPLPKEVFVEVVVRCKLPSELYAATPTWQDWRTPPVKGIFWILERSKIGSRKVILVFNQEKCVSNGFRRKLKFPEPGGFVSSGLKRKYQI